MWIARFSRSPASGVGTAFMTFFRVLALAVTPLMLLTSLANCPQNAGMDVAETHQQSEATTAAVDLTTWDWKADLKREDRSLEWLARRTDRSTSAVNGYSAGRTTPPLEWLRAAAIVLGKDPG